jgi:hypothetical protein
MNRTMNRQSAYTIGDVERLTSKIQFPATADGCWLWTGAKHSADRGYGKFRLAGKVVNAHKAAYRLFVGEVAEGLVLGHQCNNEQCCNPYHLHQESQSENCKYMIRCGRHNSQRATQ